MTPRALSCLAPVSAMEPRNSPRRERRGSVAPFPNLGDVSMSKSWYVRLLGNRKGRRTSRRDRTAVRLAGLEALDHRVLPAISATFSPAAGVLTVIGDALSNNIVVSRDAA